MTPYLTFVCFARSVALFMPESNRDEVRKAAKLAVYDEMMISAKKNHMLNAIRVDADLFEKIGTN